MFYRHTGSDARLCTRAYTDLVSTAQARHFTPLEPIRREEKAKTESRQRPRAHEVPP